MFSDPRSRATASLYLTSFSRLSVKCVCKVRRHFQITPHIGETDEKGLLILASKLLPLCLTSALSLTGAAWAEPPQTQAIEIDRTETKKVDDLHAIWTGLLSKYVQSDPSEINLFDYAALKNTPDDRQLLNDYVEELAVQPISSLPREAQFAAWANLYNALTVKVVVENYPVESIRDIRSGLFSPGPWKRDLIVVEGETLTLDNIEHDILRQEFNDTRVHYAVNCASIGCPNLQAEAFTATNLEDALNRAARDYINHPRGAHFTKTGELVVSKIYRWFQEDFGGNERGVIAHLTQYASPELAERLSSVDDIQGFEYDWSLNDASRKD